MLIMIFKIIILAGLLTLILYPFFSQAAQPQMIEGSGDMRRLLLREKDTLYAAIKELDFDYHMGKLSQEDYQNLRSSYQEQAVNLLKRLEEAASPQAVKVKKKGDRS